MALTWSTNYRYPSSQHRLFINSAIPLAMGTSGGRDYCLGFTWTQTQNPSPANALNITTAFTIQTSHSLTHWTWAINSKLSICVSLFISWLRLCATAEETPCKTCCGTPIFWVSSLSSRLKSLLTTEDARNLKHRKTLSVYLSSNGNQTFLYGLNSNTKLYAEELI